MLSANCDCVYTEMDYGWSGIHFSGEARTDGRYRAELADALALWRTTHLDRNVCKLDFMDASNTPRGINIFWNERDLDDDELYPTLCVTDPALTRCCERKTQKDWLAIARQYACDSDLSLNSRDVIVSRTGAAATFSMCKSVVLAFPLVKLVHYLGLKKMVDLRDYVQGEFQDPDTPVVLLKLPLHARF